MAERTVTDAALNLGKAIDVYLFQRERERREEDGGNQFYAQTGLNTTIRATDNIHCLVKDWYLDMRKYRGIT
jgi:hypothetical protein